MKEEHFVVMLDGCRVMIEPEAQRVTVTDASGRIAFSEEMQVAAGSKSLFSAADAVLPLVAGTSPIQKV